MPENLSTNQNEQAQALQNGAGIASLTAGWIAVTGADRVRWLNGMVTNSVQALTPGDGAYSFLLTAQGRIQGDLTVWAETDRLLLETTPQQVPAILAMLDRFIIMDDVELADQSEQWHGLTVIGPQAADKLGTIGIAARPSRLLKRQPVQWNGHALALINAYSPQVPHFELWSQNAATIDQLCSALEAAGATPCSPETLETLRIQEGIPAYGTDIRDRDLPQETAQTRALHFNKGCYLGQEIVERIRSRGNVHRTLTTFTLHGQAPAPGTPLEADGKTVGELTSIATHPVSGHIFALGVIRRETIDRGITITYAGGTATPASATEASTTAS